jgi:hypothetical protein
MFMKESAEVDFDQDDELTAEEGVLGNEEGNADIVTEAMAAWHNLEIKMMKAEHAAIVTENAQLLEDAKGGYWAKIKAFLASVWSRIKSLWSQALSAYYIATKQHLKWLEENSDKLRGLDAGSVAVRGYDYDDAKIMKALTIVAGGIGSLRNLGNGDGGNDSEDSMEKMKSHIMSQLGAKGEAGDFNSALHRAFRSGADAAKETSIRALGGVGRLYKGVKDASELIADFKAALSGMTKIADEALKLAEYGYKASNRGAELSSGSGEGSTNSAKKYRNKVMAYKNYLLACQMLSSATLSAVRERQVAFLSHLRRAAGAGGFKQADKAGMKSRAKDFGAKIGLGMKFVGEDEDDNILDQFG